MAAPVWLYRPPQRQLRDTRNRIRRGLPQQAGDRPRSARLRATTVASGLSTDAMVNALIKNARKLSQELYRSLARDRGKEMAGHKRFKTVSV